MTETSIPQLYLAGFLPGLVLALLFMATVLIGCALRPAWGGDPIATDWQARWRSLPDLVPPLLIFVLVIGSIYAGLATPTEAAALGVIAALALAAWRRRLSWPMLRATIEGTMRTSAMIMAILMAAYFLNFVLTSIGLTGQVNALVTGLGLSPMQTLLAVVGFYLVLGMFMETLTMMVATVPIVTPVIIAQGFDPVWFGVLMMLLIETAMITPPVGINLFVVQGVRGRGQLHDVMLGAAPFVVTLLVMTGLLILFPQIALWLPQLLSPADRGAAGGTERRRHQGRRSADQSVVRRSGGQRVAVIVQRKTCRAGGVLLDHRRGRPVRRAAPFERRADRLSFGHREPAPPVRDRADRGGDAALLPRLRDERDRGARAARRARRPQAGPPAHPLHDAGGRLHPRQGAAARAPASSAT